MLISHPKRQKKGWNGKVQWPRTSSTVPPGPLSFPHWGVPEDLCTGVLRRTLLFTDRYTTFIERWRTFLWRHRVRTVSDRPFVTTEYRFARKMGPQVVSGQDPCTRRTCCAMLPRSRGWRLLSFPHSLPVAWRKNLSNSCVTSYKWVSLNRSILACKRSIY